MNLFFQKKTKSNLIFLLKKEGKVFLVLLKHLLKDDAA